MHRPAAAPGKALSEEELERKATGLFQVRADAGVSRDEGLVQAETGRGVPGRLAWLMWVGAVQCVPCRVAGVYGVAAPIHGVASPFDCHAKVAALARRARVCDEATS